MNLLSDKIVKMAKKSDNTGGKLVTVSVVGLSGKNHIKNKTLCSKVSYLTLFYIFNQYLDIISPLLILV